MSRIVNRRRSVLHDLGTHQPVFFSPYSMQDFLLPHLDNYLQDNRTIPTEPTGLYKQYAPQAKHKNHQVVPSSVVLLSQALFSESFDGSAMRYAACNLNVLSECRSNTYSMLDFTDEDIKMGEECLKMNEDSPEPLTTQPDPQIQPKVQRFIQPQIKSQAKPIYQSSSSRSYHDYIRWSSRAHDYATPQSFVINKSQIKIEKTGDVSNEHVPQNVYQRVPLSAAEQPRHLTHDTINTLTDKVIDIKKEISSDTLTSGCDNVNIVRKSDSETSIKMKSLYLYHMTCKRQKTN